VLTLRRMPCLLSVSLVLLCLMAFSVNVQAQPKIKKDQIVQRSVTVEDAIRMTRLADPSYFHGNDINGHVAQFSPDGKLFVVVLRKGNLEKNTNEFSLLLYRTVEAMHSPTAEIVLRMSSSSNRDGITQVRWLSDNETLLFLGEGPGELSQVYELNVRTRRLTKRTTAVLPITDYDCSSDGKIILFRAEARYGQVNVPDEEQVRRQGVVITDQSLQDLIAGRYGQRDLGEVFVQRPGDPLVRLPIPNGRYVRGGALSISPNGKYALVRANLKVSALSKRWAEYDYGPNVTNYLRSVFFRLPPIAAFSPFTQYILMDLVRGSAKPLWDAPSIFRTPIVWSNDSNSIFIAKAYLPLDDAGEEENRLRKRERYDIKVSVDTGEYQKVSADGFPKVRVSASSVEITIEEDINTPPKIFAIDSQSKQKALLLDLNPQFNNVKLGKVEVIEVTVQGVNLIGGLYLPHDYMPGKKYPLVIQTHGFSPQRFSLDGAIEWSSGFAARPLAASGIAVLQMQEFKTRNDKDHYNDGHKFGTTDGQAGRNINVQGIETAIDYLNARGLIDRDRVGIMGFSISVSWVAYLLTHSSHHFAAASLIDGVDGGYFQELIYPQNAFDKDEKNGGAAPFGEGLKTWLKESPSFSLGNVTAPLRLLALGASNDASELWEWFAGLSLQKKPVDYILLPDADHLVVKPWERIVAQQGSVDWFRYWLKDEEDSDAAKTEQYSRWSILRQMQLQIMKPTSFGIGRIPFAGIVDFAL
jgi:dipeptidyl aminopeptidase/acylaminoacyl peptidase